MLTNEPRFPQIYDQIKQLLTNAPLTIIYNAEFDTTMLHYTCRLHDRDPIIFESNCAMEQCAQWVGQWSDYHGNFRWQPLSGGDHTALGDCQATFRLIQDMAGTQDKD